MGKAIVYTKNNCKYCQIVKNFLKDREVECEVRNIEDTELDENGVAKGDKYREEFEQYAFQSVPLTLIGDHQIVGFNLGLLNKAVEEHG